MENKRLIKLTNIDGSTLEAEVLLFFKMGNKDYIIYTLNESNNDMMMAYASNLISNNGKYQLVNIENEAEWKAVKAIMKDIVTNGKLSS
jgi:uncharacterized protein YrzB (UPF0473 family)